MAILTAPAPSGGDDQTALQNFLNSAASGDYLSFPFGAVYKHSARLLYKNAAQNVTIMAEGVVWEATDSSKASFFFDGAVNVEIVGLWHRTAVKPTSRINLANDVGPFAFNSTTGVKLRRVRSSGSAGLAYYFWNFRDGEITDCIAEDSLADGFHFTNGSRNFTVAGCQAINNGDDAFAFIGYQTDGAANGQPQYITLTNPVVRDCRARGISLAGAKNITVNNPDIDGTLAANIYFAVERGDFNTLDTSDCTVNGGRLTRAGTSYPAITNGTDGAGKDQGSVLWLSSGSGAVVTRCVVNDVSVGATGAANYDTFRAIQYSGTFVGCAANRTQLFNGAPSTYIGGNIPSAISPATSTDRRTETLAILDSVNKPTYVNSVTYENNGGNTGGQNYTMTVPTGVKESDVGVILSSWVTGATSDTQTYSGPGTATVRMAPTAFTNMISQVMTVTGVKAGDVMTFNRNTNRFITTGITWYANARVETFGAPTARGASASTVVAAAINEKSSSSLSVIIATERTTATGTVVSSVSPGPATQRMHFEGTGNSTCAVTILDTRPTTYTTNTAPAQTVTYNSGSTNGGAMQMEMAYQKATATTSATVSRATLGLPTPTSIRAAAKLVGASSARLAVSTASSMAGASYSASRTPDSLQYVGGQDLPLEVTGLTADTVYYWQMELDGVLVGPVGQTRTLPAASGAASYGFAAGCCNLTGSDVLVFDALRTMTGANGKTAAFFAHLGDIHYSHSGTSATQVEANDATEIASHYEASLGTTRQSALYRTIPLSHSFSDNDFCGSNSDSTAAAAATVTATRRRLLADPPLPGTGVYKTWVIGRVRYIQTDSRSFLSAKGSNGTYLGSTQKQWFKDTLTAATEPIIVWFNDNNWAGTATNSTALDDWRNYSTERSEIANFITANGHASKLLFIHGDSHSLAYDSGANNPFGGFPMINIGPLNQNSSDHPAVNAYDGGKYPTSNGVASQQYGWFDVADNGTLLTVTFKGYSVDSGTGATTQRMTYTKSYTTPTPPRTDVEAIPGTLTVLKADSLSAIANGANVTAWGDKKNRLNFVAGNAAPTKVAAGALNSKPAVRFNGSTQNMVMSNAPALAQPFTIGFVIAPTTVTGDKQLYWQGNGGEAAIYQGQWFEYSGAGYSLTSPTPSTGGKVLTYEYSGSQSAIVVNGADGTPATGNPGTVGMTAGQALLMDHGTVDRYFGGDLYEMRVWDHVLTAAEEQGWHSYCQDEYGVTVADYKAGTQTSTGSAALTGSGTASSVSIPNHTRAGALSGSGTASPAATAAFAGAVSPNGAGTAAPTGVGGYPGVAAASGSGTVAYGTATPTVSATFPLSGSGTTASKVGDDYINASTATGSGTAITAATLAIATTALESGSGTATYASNIAIGGTGSSTWVAYFSDGFNRTQSSPINGFQANAAWSTNGTRVLTSATSVTFLITDGSAPSLDQRVSAVQYVGGNNGVVLRYIDNQNFYGFRRSSGTAQMFTAIGGTVTLIGSTLACAVGDRITLTATETDGGTTTTLQAQVNTGTIQTVVITAAGSRLSGYKMGLRAQAASGSTAEFDDFIASTLITTPAGVPGALSGSGTPTATGTQGFSGVALETGSGSLSTVSLASTSGSAAATGGSNILAEGSAISGAQSSQNLTGSGTTTTSQVAAISGSGSASGSGSILAIGAPNFPGTGLATGSGSVNTAASTSPAGIGYATGNGVVDTVRLVAFVASAALSGSGTTAPAGRPTAAGAAAPNGSGSVGVVLAEGYFGNRTLTGSGTAAGAGVPNTGRVGLLTGSGTTTTEATLAPVAATAASGSGQLVATGTPAFAQSRSASGLGVVNTTSLVTASGSSVATGSGTTDPTARFAVSASAAVASDGYASPLNGAADFRKSATLSGAGFLSSTTDKVVAAGTATPTGGSSVSFPSPGVTVTTSANPNGSGSILSSSIAGKASEVVGLGGGSRTLTLDRSALFQIAVAFGAGDIATALRLTASGRVVLFGEGLLTGIYGEDYRDVDLDVGPPYTNSRAYRPVDRLRKV